MVSGLLFIIHCLRVYGLWFTVYYSLFIGLGFMIDGFRVWGVWFEERPDEYP